MEGKKNGRRKFMKHTALGVAGLSVGLNARSYGRILGANDRVNVGIVGFSGRFRGSLLPAFLGHKDAMNFDIVGVSDFWNKRRNEGEATLTEKTGHKVTAYRNNEELYEDNKIDAVIISTADFQHALHTVQAAEAGKDV